MKTLDLGRSSRETPGKVVGQVVGCWRGLWGVGEVPLVDMVEAMRAVVESRRQVWRCEARCDNRMRERSI